MTPPDRRPDRPPTAPAAAPCHRVLIVEDDALIRSMLADAAERAGFSVQLASSLQQALELAATGRFDLAVLDYRLPDGNGIQVAELLHVRCRVPFLFFSAFADESLVRRAVELGALGYLVKPIDPRTLGPTLRAACARAIERRQSSASAVRAHAAAKRGAAKLERTRLAAELHDGLGQELTAINILVGLIERNAQCARTERLASDVGRLRELVGEAFGKCRALSHQLFTQRGSSRDIGCALQALVERQAAISEIACTYSGPLRTPHAIGARRAHALYRIAQEAIGNAVRHSGASIITVELSFPNEHLRLSIRDNGRGFRQSAKSATGGIGMLTMRSRAEQLGGTFTMRAVDPSGTEVCVDLPMRRRACARNGRRAHRT